MASRSLFCSLHQKPELIKSRGSFRDPWLLARMQVPCRVLVPGPCGLPEPATEPGPLWPLLQGRLNKQMSNGRMGEGQEPLLQAALPHPEYSPRPAPPCPPPQAQQSSPCNDLGPWEPRCLPHLPLPSTHNTSDILGSVSVREDRSPVA